MVRDSVAYLGVPGSFSHSAALRQFERNSEYHSYPNFQQIFTAVESGACSVGVVPLENSLAGSIYENYDLIKKSSLSIVGEIYLAVEHHLCGTTDTGLKEVQKIYSHPKAFEQIGGFIAENPTLELEATADTASAAKKVSLLKDNSSAAVCSEAAAQIYGLKILKRNLEDDPLNYTRFAILSAKQSTSPLDNKCSLLMSLPHVPKSLFRALEIVVSAALNTTKIESRPIPGKPFEYAFYLDFEFDCTARSEIRQMLDSLAQYAVALKVIGFYQKAELERKIT